ncbi:MAG: hypothetical protein KGJ60_12255 [Verrucomicrobiota bacterium]|nr:hypothetical protein [Verrucomicrobiota bacterium]
MDHFEQRLSRQPLRRVPAEWRGEILTTAQEGAVSHPPAPAARDSIFSTFATGLSALLWPCPQAWAGLAAVWILILAVDFSTRDRTPALAEKAAPPSPEVVAQLRQQQRLLAELIGPRDTGDADRSKSLAPGPRSECVEFLTA